MKNKVKLPLEDLKKELSEIPVEQMLELMGGNLPPTYDCVINCFDYLDGARHDYNYYLFSINYYLGYDPNSIGGVYTSDIPTIGGFGGMYVNSLSTPTVSIDASGKVNGNSVMMTVYSEPQHGAYQTGMHHAVVVTSNYIDFTTGQRMINYYDPSMALHGSRPIGQATNFYEIQHR